MTIQNAITGLNVSARCQQMLRGMYDPGKQEGLDGNLHEIDQLTRISREQGRLLFDLVRERPDANTLEIGLAYGFSTAWMMAAHECDHGSHTAIDPFQIKDWSGIGLRRIELLGMSDRLTWIEDRSALAIPDLIKHKSMFGLIFIDGCHRFDDVIVDFYLSDQVCEVGGVIILDDLWMPSVQRVTSFIEKNRSYAKIKQPVANTVVFKKLAEDTRPWNHYVEFCARRSVRQIAAEVPMLKAAVAAARRLIRPQA